MIHLFIFIYTMYTTITKTKTTPNRSPNGSNCQTGHRNYKVPCRISAMKLPPFIISFLSFVIAVLPAGLGPPAPPVPLVPCTCPPCSSVSLWGPSPYFLRRFLLRVLTWMFLATLSGSVKN